MRIIRLHSHDGPMWALPKVSAYLHMDSTDYFEQCMLHGLQQEGDLEMVSWVTHWAMGGSIRFAILWMASKKLFVIVSYAVHLLLPSFTWNVWAPFTGCVCAWVQLGSVQLSGQAWSSVDCKLEASIFGQKPVEKMEGNPAPASRVRVRGGSRLCDPDPDPWPTWEWTCTGRRTPADH
jgi:hypothetical protein